MVTLGTLPGTRNFTFESLGASHNRRQNWRERIALCYQKEVKGGHFEQILEAASNNLNSAEACALIDSLELDISDWEKIDTLFGLRLIIDTPDVSSDIYNLIHERDEARKNKDFEKSDRIRDELLEKGISLNDSPDGATWYYKD